MTKEEFRRLKTWVRQNKFKILEYTDKMIYIYISNGINIILWIDGSLEIIRDQQEVFVMIKFTNRTDLQMKQILEGLTND